MDTALVVIDMQNDFCLPDADLFVGQAPACIPHVRAAVEGFRAVGLPVVWVMRRHRAAGCDVDHTRRELFAARPFLASSPGVDLVAGLEPRPDEPVVEKRRWSAFFATDLDLVLRRLRVERVVLAGVQTPNCIRATACDATSLDYVCMVLSDATASATTEVQRANLFDLGKMGVGVQTTAQLVRELATRRGQPDG